MISQEDLQYVEFVKDQMFNDTFQVDDLNKVVDVFYQARQYNLKGKTFESFKCFFGRNESEEIIWFNQFKELISHCISSDKASFKDVLTGHSVNLLINSIVYDIEMYQRFKVRLKTLIVNERLEVEMFDRK